MEEEHLIPICEDENPIFDNYDSSDDDSSVEITSKYLHLESVS